MPMLLKGEETGVEFDVFEGRSAIDEFEPGDVDASFDRCANFRWGGDETEMLAALCASAALAKLTGGVVVRRGRGQAAAGRPRRSKPPRKIYAPLTKPETSKHPARARPNQTISEAAAETAQRSRTDRAGAADPPGSALVRGAFLDRTSDKYGFRIRRYITPAL